MRHRTRAAWTIGIVATLLAAWSCDPTRSTDVQGCHDCWTTLAVDSSMPGFASSLGAAVVDGVVYNVPGSSIVFDSGPSMMALSAYDPKTDAWTPLAFRPPGRQGVGVAALNGLVYVVGGNDADSAISRVDAYDPVTNTWTAKAPMPTPRTGVGVGVVNGLLYAVGGLGFPYTPYTTVEAYDPHTDSWTTKAPMPISHIGLGVGVVDGMLYAIGGFSDNALAEVDAYDPVADSWQTKAPMPTGRYQFGVGVVNGLLYAAGGIDANNQPSSALEAYDPVTDTWGARAPLPSVSPQTTGVVVIDSTLYVVTTRMQAYRP